MTSLNSDDASLQIETTENNADAVVLASVGGNASRGSGSQGGTQSGDGGPGGDASTITVDSIAVKASTRGASATGFSATSRGGAGGNAGTNDDSPPALCNGGRGGAAGAVSIEAAFDISTIGDGATGIKLNSVGGGGGSGGNNGQSSDGNEVSLTLAFESAGVTTKGDNASAIVASSIGGAESSSTTGSSVGSGGDVSVFVNGDALQTEGSQSHGVAAASLAAGQLGTSDTATATAGEVAVVIAEGATVTTTGPTAHGVYARSIGPGTTVSHNGESIQIANAGSISATGVGSMGIFAQSTGLGAETITIGNDEGGTVTGGAAVGDGTKPDGAAIRVSGGTDENTIVNEGEITAGSSGLAIVYNGTGKLKVSGSGTITGSVVNASEDEDASTLITGRGGVLQSGTRLDAEVSNRGLLSPGGEGAQLNTKVSGNLTQTSTGALLIEVSGNGTHDLLDVSGTASLGGEVAAELTDLDSPLIGRKTRIILTADEGVTVADGLSITESLVAGIELVESANNRVRIGFEVDFQSDEANASLNSNQINLADHLQDLYQAGLIDTDLAGALIALDDANDYAGIVNNLSAEVALDNQITAVQSFRAFQEQLLSCADIDGTGAVRFLDDGSCVFATARGAGFERDSSSDNLGYEGSAWSVSGGGQVAVDEGWTIGGALGYEWQRLDVSGTSASSDDHSVFGGASVKRHFGALELGASASAGYATYDINRQPFQGGSVNGGQNFWSLGGGCAPRMSSAPRKPSLSRV